HYFIGANDNNGDKIMDAEAILGTEVLVYDSEDITEDGNELSVTGPATSGIATLLGLVVEEESGGFEFEVTDLNGDYIIGFNREADTIPYVDSLFEFGLYIDAAGTSYAFKKGNDSIAWGSVTVGDEFKMF